MSPERLKMTNEKLNVYAWIGAIVVVLLAGCSSTQKVDYNTVRDILSVESASLAQDVLQISDMAKLEGKQQQISFQVSTALMAVSEALDNTTGDTDVDMALSLVTESLKSAQEMDWATYVKDEDTRLKIKVFLYAAQSIVSRIKRYKGKFK